MELPKTDPQIDRSIMLRMPIRTKKQQKCKNRYPMIKCLAHPDRNPLGMMRDARMLVGPVVAVPPALGGVAVSSPPLPPPAPENNVILVPVFWREAPRLVAVTTRGVGAGEELLVRLGDRIVEEDGTVCHARTVIGVSKKRKRNGEKKVSEEDGEGEGEEDDEDEAVAILPGPARPSSSSDEERRTATTTQDPEPEDPDLQHRPLKKPKSATIDPQTPFAEVRAAFALVSHPSLTPLPPGPGQVRSGRACGSACSTQDGSPPEAARPAPPALLPEAHIHGARHILYHH